MRIRNLLLYLWQLPQNLLGLLLRAIYRGEDTDCGDALVRMSARMQGGISLGRYIIVSEKATIGTVMHEYGHCRQSKMLGPLYLLVVGLPSLTWSCIYPCRMFPYSRNGYYRFYTEKWADRLGEVKR